MICNAGGGLFWLHGGLFFKFSGHCRAMIVVRQNTTRFNDDRQSISASIKAERKITQVELAKRAIVADTTQGKID